MNKGTVKFYNDSKGFGFITDTASSKEYFVHSTGVKENTKLKLNGAELKLKLRRKTVNA